MRERIIGIAYNEPASSVYAFSEASLDILAQVEAVEEALEEAGVSPERLAVVGFSEYHPTVANAPTQKGNQANRRVEIWIVPPRQFLTGAR